MDNNKALDILKQAINYREDGSCQKGSWILGTDGVEAVKVAIIALETQIPYKVDKFDCCPVCNTYGRDEDGASGDYCPNCGQALDWE